MRPVLAAPVLLAACLVASVATAANVRIANWNTKATIALASVQSIGIQQASVNMLVARAAVPQ